MKSGTQPTEMAQLAILWADTEPAFRIRLPVPVIDVLQYENYGVEQPLDHVDLLVRSYQEWEAQPERTHKARDNGALACFRNRFRAPDMLFWTLAHLSDVNFPIAEQQHGALIFHTLEVLTSIRRAYISLLLSTATTHAVDYCWYLLVRLMVIEYALAARAGASPAVQRQIGFIRWHYGYLVEDLRRFHEFGWLTTACPRQDFERRLIDLAANEPRLTSIAARIIRDWEQIEKIGRDLQSLAKVMGSELHYEIDEEDLIHAGTVEADLDNADSPRERQRTLHKMFCLEQAMTPESDDDLAWHHPVEYIENCARGRRVVYLDTAVEDFCDEELSNGQKFQLALIERLAEQGFRRWLFSKPEIHLHCIHTWLRDCGDSRSMKSLCDGVRRYMKSPSARRQRSLRDILMFPGVPESEFVTREVRFWEEVRAAKGRVAADVRLFMAQHENEMYAALKWIRPNADRKYIVIGDGRDFQTDYYLNRRAPRNRFLVVRHRLAVPDDNLAGTFNLFWALSQAADEIGRKKGRGIHQSAILPIKGNRRFLAAFESGDLQQALPDLDRQFLITESNGYADAVIFTAEDDGEENAAYFEPSATDSAVSLVGAGN